MCGQLRKHAGVNEFRSSSCFLPFSPEITTCNRERKAVFVNSAVKKNLPLLSGWKAWNRVKNQSYVYFAEDKLEAECIRGWFWLSVIRVGFFCP